ncbi:hypothetical protein DEU56DRAFT_920244 [Suillus clintonianus]|uniref:uncharacterized protein n=1 Tax=Suillus clintonianus TaxID=1904413 RepID=UPI001B86632A|nr:uncharacterized protein DEU56DRAFT_920244 [Suillus clintonianus]KAG2110097.1 hypothetical protein DEU56DRAFT_920244 [Suillus clintonianus]
MSQLLDCSIPIWPTQLGRYTEMARSPDSLQRNYDIDMMQIELPQSEMHGGWTELVHPSGAVYNYNAGMKTFAEMNLRTCSEERLRRLESWVRASRAKLNGKGYLLVVEPIVVQEKEVYPYYYVVPENHIITWVEPVNGYLLFQESMASHWNHKRLELEAQFWKHAEYFPHEITIPLSEVRALRIQLNWYRVEALAIEQSTAASIFWTLDQMKEMTDELIIAGTAQAKAQTTVASVIMAVNASILAVPGLGTQLTTKTMCSISFVLSFYCIIGYAFYVGSLAREEVIKGRYPPPMDAGFCSVALTTLRTTSASSL